MTVVLISAYATVALLFSRRIADILLSSSTFDAKHDRINAGLIALVLSPIWPLLLAAWLITAKRKPRP